MSLIIFILIAISLCVIADLWLSSVASTKIKVIWTVILSVPFVGLLLYFTLYKLPSRLPVERRGKYRNPAAPDSGIENKAVNISLGLGEGSKIEEPSRNRRERRERDRAK